MANGKDKDDPRRRTRLPGRGRVLCILESAIRIQSIESELASNDYTLLRARHGMHGFWMAINGKPDAIVIEVVNPDLPSNYLLENLHRNVKTRDIPVVALIDARCQIAPAASCLKHVALSMSDTTPAEEVVASIAELIQMRTAEPAIESPAHASEVDAYFSELGHEIAHSPNIAPHLIPSSSRPMADQKHSIPVPFFQGKTIATPTTPAQ